MGAQIEYRTVAPRAVTAEDAYLAVDYNHSLRVVFESHVDSCAQMQ